MPYRARDPQCAHAETSLYGAYEKLLNPRAQVRNARSRVTLTEPPRVMGRLWSYPGLVESVHLAQRLARSRAFDQPHLCLAAGDDFLRVESPGPVAGCWPLGPGPPFRVAALEQPRVRLPRSLPGDGATGAGLDVPGGIEFLGDGRRDAGTAGYAGYPNEPFVFGFGFGLFYGNYIRECPQVVGGG